MCHEFGFRLLEFGCPIFLSAISEFFSALFTASSVLVSFSLSVSVSFSFHFQFHFIDRIMPNCFEIDFIVRLLADFLFFFNLLFAEWQELNCDLLCISKILEYFKIFLFNFFYKWMGGHILIADC